MSVIGLIVILLFLGAVLWFVNSRGQIGGSLLLIINLVVVVIALILVLQAFGIWDELRGLKVPKI